ncbi:MFS transporter [Actinoplanes sp. NPDC051494]|uniref:MFS transporter n=1 Tax=Actinoplanes sp. NPDC051494 TaxID=3363907 RepID=UPI00379DB478
MTPAPATLWRNREFNLLWVSQSCSDLGTAISGLAVPLLVLALTASPLRAGAVGTVGLVVTVLSRLPAGVLADRFDRRRIMLVCDAIRLVAYLVLGCAVLRGQASLALVVAVVVVASGANAFFGTAEYLSLRTIVAAEQLPAAVARNEARAYGTSLAGPPLGGLLFGLGHAVPFLGDAVTFLASMIGVAMVRRPLQEPRETAPGSHLSALAEGVRFVLGNSFLRTVVLVVAPLNLALHGVIFTVIVTMQAHRVTPAVIGTVETVVGVGGLLGAVLAPALTRRLVLPVLNRAVCWSAAVLMSLSALVTDSVAAAVPVGLAVLLGPATNAALFGHQAAVTPDRLQGRVVSVIIVLATSIAAAAPLLAGLMITTIGPQTAILAFAAMVCCSAVAASVTHSLRV